MGIFDGCLLASDIDGTLVDSGYINPRNVEMIRTFVNEGGKFCLCTGRSIGAVECVLRQLDGVSHSVTANGCMIYDYEESKTLYELHLPKLDYKAAQLACESFPNVGSEIHAGINVLTLNRTPDSDLHQKYEELPTNCVDFNTACDYNWNKVVYFLTDETLYNELIPFLENNVTDCKLIVTSAIIDGLKRNYLEQVPKGVSKLSALKKLCEMLDIKEGKLFAIGDYYNDLEMIKNADISAVTVDTPDDIKQYAKFVGGSCKDGAVADFIEYLIEVKKPKG